MLVGVGGPRHASAALPLERTGINCTGGWVDLRVGLDDCGKSRPTGIRSPDLPARSESLYRLSYPAQHCNIMLVFYNLLPDGGPSWPNKRRSFVKLFCNNNALSWFNCSRAAVSTVCGVSHAWLTSVYPVPCFLILALSLSFPISSFPSYFPSLSLFPYSQQNSRCYKPSVPLLTICIIGFYWHWISGRSLLSSPFIFSNDSNALKFLTFWRRKLSWKLYHTPRTFL